MEAIYETSSGKVIMVGDSVRITDDKLESIGGDTAAQIYYTAFAGGQTEDDFDKIYIGDPELPDGFAAWSSHKIVDGDFVQNEDWPPQQV